MDYYSRWIEIKYLSSTTSAAVIHKMKDIFATNGIPSVVHSDNDPQYSSDKFCSYANEYGFEHTTSSPTFSQANGQAECGVAIAKQILSQSDSDFAVLNYQSTPHSAIDSPAEALLGRKRSTILPLLPLMPRH